MKFFISISTVLRDLKKSNVIDSFEKLNKLNMNSVNSEIIFI